MNGTLRIIITLFTIILLSPIASYAHGRHGFYRGGGGIWMDPWWFAPPLPPYSYYSPPPVIVEQHSDEDFFQPPPPQTEEPVYWYYCRKPEGYYPYVKNCPDGWMKVVPTPPANK